MYSMYVKAKKLDKTKQILCHATQHELGTCQQTHTPCFRTNTHTMYKLQALLVFSGGWTCSKDTRGGTGMGLMMMMCVCKCERCCVKMLRGKGRGVCVCSCVFKGSYPRNSAAVSSCTVPPLDLLSGGGRYT